MLGLRFKLSFIVSQLGVESGQCFVTFGVKAIDLFSPLSQFLFDRFNSLDGLNYLSFECSDLFLQSIGLTHRCLVFLLILSVFKVAVGTFEVGLIFGDLFLKIRPVGMELISLCLDLTNRKSVLFKLLFDLSTLCNCGFDYLF